MRSGDRDRCDAGLGVWPATAPERGLELYGAGQWLEQKHGARSRRSWRKLHLALDGDNGEIIAHALTGRDTGAAVIIPPRANAVERADTEPPGQRDRHIASINNDGRMNWQAATGYDKRSLVETAIGTVPRLGVPLNRSTRKPAPGFRQGHLRAPTSPRPSREPARDRDPAIHPKPCSSR